MRAREVIPGDTEKDKVWRKTEGKQNDGAKNDWDAEKDESEEEIQTDDEH